MSLRTRWRIGDLPTEAAKKWGDRPALVFEGRRWTHTEFEAEVERVARGLIGIGVEHGDHVGLWVTNRPEFCFLMYAVARVGAVTVPFNTRYRTDDIAYTVDQCDASTFISVDQGGPIDYLSMVAEILPSLPKVKRTVIIGEQTLDGTITWDDLLAAGATVTAATSAARAEAVEPADDALIIYTSGTTSLPKGALHTHEWFPNHRERAVLLGHTFNDVHMSYLPLFHAFGYAEVALMCALSGACQVLTESFDADEVLDLAEAEGATVCHGFDVHWADLIKAQEARPRNLSLRVGTLAAGMESSTPTARRANELFCPTVSGWGMSETWPFVACTHPTHSVELRSEASGYPMTDMEFRVLDPETGADQPPGLPGELLFRGFTMMKGYYSKPEATAETIDADGWLHSGDLVRMRADGHLVFIGRLKDMLKVGGENMAPAEIEGRLLQMDGVAEVAVVGYPDARLGEVPVAFVVQDGSTDIDGDTLRAALKGRIASFKIPRHIWFVEAMPMTPSGKIRKVELRAMAQTQITSRQ